nr:PREDICTED: 39S ribosomal protein L46, mitochondrial isoform X1 [Haliaeetus albicilla]XP_009922145.1 PREDICTED: 39S ribosomal protein L46, mitochondrial isoform X1 [Haliaeetus albicilla]
MLLPAMKLIPSALCAICCLHQVSWVLIELEKSHYSDHEIRRLEEEEQLRRRKESMYDDDDEAPGKTVIMAQDLEDKWEQKLLQFKAAPRITDADKNNNRTSLNRKLDSNLMLLVKQKLGNQELWLLPQVEWQPGETLRSTAERAMATFLGDHIQAKILGNAPYGIYKYKFPRAIRTEDNVGAKVFFFKAFLQSSDFSQAELKEDYLWVTKDELGDYLKSEYLKKVNRFLLDFRPGLVRRLCLQQREHLPRGSKCGAEYVPEKLQTFSLLSGVNVAEGETIAFSRTESSCREES